MIGSPSSVRGAESPLHVRGASGHPSLFVVLRSPLPVRGAALALPRSWCSGGSFVGPRFSQPHLPVHGHTPSQRLGCPSHFGSRPHPVPLSQLAQLNPSSLAGSRPLLRRVSFLAANHSLKQTAAAVARRPSRPSVPRRLTNGPPWGGPRTSARRSAASRRPTARYHLQLATRAPASSPRRPLLSSKPLGAGSPESAEHASCSSARRNEIRGGE